MKGRLDTRATAKRVIHKRLRRKQCGLKENSRHTRRDCGNNERLQKAGIHVRLDSAQRSNFVKSAICPNANTKSCSRRLNSP